MRLGCWWPVLISGFTKDKLIKLNSNLAHLINPLCASACAFTNTAEDCTSIPPTLVVRAPIQLPEGAGCGMAHSNPHACWNLDFHEDVCQALPCLLATPINEGTNTAEDCLASRH